MSIINENGEFQFDSSIKKIEIEESDHLSNCIKFFGVLHLDLENDLDICNEQKGNILYSSKFKMKDKKNQIFNKLGAGFHILKYKDTSIYIYIYNIGGPLGLNEETKIHVRYFIYIDKNKLNILTDFFDSASDYYVKQILDKNKEIDKTTIYIWDDYWETIEKRPHRNLSTIYLGGVENKVYDKIKNFLSEDTKKIYNDLGIPYKYNMLFHGYPGTGKSSLIFSLASELNMDIALLHFVSDMNDVDFMRAIRRIPENTILVLEDIDVLFEARKKNDENKSGISFSGLLNSLDGISHVDNQIIFMTTNCKMVLDKALTRPGRIDLDIEFKYSAKQQIKTMFEKFLPSQTKKFSEFYKQIKGLKLTTAMLQQYFFGNIKCTNILDSIDELKEICDKNDYENKKDTLYT
jgi:predicted AAA+ superfamily ATPase